MRQDAAFLKSLELVPDELGHLHVPSDLTREALYKALRPSSQPRFDTIHRVCNALGVRLVAQAGSARS